MGMFDIKRTPQQAITRIKHLLSRDKRFEFYGGAAFATETVFDPSLPYKGATNGLKIFINPDLIQDADDDVLMHLLCHEIEHICAEHLIRFERLYKDKEKRDRINVACDDPINKNLHKAGLKKYEEYVWLGDKFNGKSEEWIYANLEDEDIEKYSGSCSDFILSEDSEKQPTEEQLKKLKNAYVDVAKNAKDCNNIPGSIKQLLDLDGKQHKVSWSDYLRLALFPLYARRKSWRTPNRKLIYNGLYVPGKFKEGTDELFILFDTSGSMSIDELRQCHAEYTHIKDEFKPSKLHLMYFHTSVWRYDCISYYEDIPKIESLERGGTSFQAALDYIKEKNLDPKVAIFMSDGECPAPKKPNYDIIWCSTNKFPADYGIQIELDFERS